MKKIIKILVEYKLKKIPCRDLLPWERTKIAPKEEFDNNDIDFGQ